MLYFPRWKQLLIWFVVACGVIIALPNILPNAISSWLPRSYAGLHLPIGLDLQGGSRLGVKFESKAEALNYRDDTIEVMKRRLELSPVHFNDFRVIAQGSDQIRVDVPGLFNVQLLKDVVSTTAELEFYVQNDSISADDVLAGKVALPDGLKLTYSMDDPPVSYLVPQKPLLNNADIASAFIEKIDENSANLTITFTDHGMKKLENFVKADHSTALIAVFDHEMLAVLKYPHEVHDEFVRIGPFEKDVAVDLAAVFSAGKLPTDITLIEERTIGADMGENYARAGLYAAFGALFVVALFMVLSYGVLGLIADIALGVNLILLVAALTIIGQPLSLAGFAGLVLIIGVSVDANILIYERIREDWRNGFSLVQSVQSGFSGALGTIVDADITTLIAALVLFLLGVGPIHGFALVVTIGIITSLFTTVTLTRMMIVWGLKRFKPRSLARRPVRIIPVNTSIGFMRIRFWTLGISTVLIIATLGLYASMGVNYGIDFSGGSLAVLKAKKGEADTGDIESRLWNLNIGGVSVEEGKDRSEALVSIASQDFGEDAEQTVSLKLRAELGDDYSLERMDVVGPTVSSELRKASALAMIISLIAILGYVWLRFRWQFALGAVLTTIHDIIILFGIFIFLQWQFNIWSIAAILAVIGYSLNDTIVVYDRVRSLLRRSGSITMASLVDLAINRTLSRTVLTSLATLIAHIPLYYFGGADMRNFASVLLLGIIIGTFSSIFIAGPLLVLFGVKPQQGEEEPVLPVLEQS